MSKRVRRLSQEKRKNILEGAVEIFTDKGFDGAGMDMIAEAAGVSKITIYKHFENKEALFLAMVSEYLGENKEYKPIRYEREVDLAQQLKAFVKAEVYRVEDNRQRGLSRLLTSVYLYRPDLVENTMRRHPFFVDFISWIEEAKTDGKLIYKSEKLTAQIFYGLIHGCITWDALLTDGASLEGVDEIVDELIATFLTRYGV